MAEIVACQWTNTIKLKARFIFFVMLLSLLTSLVAMAQEVVIIDAGAPDIPTLVDDVSRQSQAGRDIHVVILDGERDGVAQVTDILKTYHHLQAVHIVSHGGEGQIQLGNDWLDEAGLRRRAAAVASWGMSLAPGGDMLLYGCRLAGDERGRAFVEQLRRLTAVDVAASRDATGHASAGGDWSLDYRAGAIEAAQAFSRTLQAAYPHVLEGTREVSPTNTDYAMLKSAEISATLGSPWAYYNAPASRRLNFRIANPANETVYIGFSQQADAGLDNVAVNNPLYFRIVDPSGSVVYGPFMIEPTGFGTPAGGADGPYLPNIPFANVAGHAQASAGPNTISAAGYDVSDPDSNAATDNPWVFQPAAPGDYRIEFDANNVAGGSVAMAIRWFDITVADTSGASPVAINGRVWSPSWQFRTREPGGGTFAEPFNGSVFVYHDLHRFVTEVDFNGANFRGLTFQLAFNQDGPGISGNVAADRRSVNNTNSVDPVFPIFLNDPDSSEFPSGAIGVVSTPLGINDLASLDITVNVTQPGQVELILDFDDDGGFTPGRDRVFFQDVSAGDNAIAWDGLDGAGATINVNTFNGGSGIPAIVIYTQGATHLMAYDVEGLDNGFAINQTRPTTNLNVLQFWDDSNIPDDPNGAAPETKVNVDAGATPRQIWTNASYGDLNTINTWWFGNRVVRDTIVLPPEADLIITQVDSADPVNPGGTLTYTITVTNNGPDNATNVVATDTLPAGVTLVSTSGCSEDPAGAPTCTLGDIAASSSAQYTITVTIDAGASGVIMNTASVASDTMDPNAANNSSSENTTVNAPPVAVNDSALTQLNTPVTLSVTGNDSDSDGVIDTATVDLDPSTGGQQSTFVVAGEGTFSDDGSGNVTFTPAPGFTGSSSISYTVNDNDGATSNAATITVTVNAPPVAVNDSALTQLNTPVTLSVTGNDSDSDGVIGAATVDLDPSTGGQQSTFVVAGEGTFSDDGSGNVTFTPEVGFTGVSTISYTVNDNDGGLSNAATISVRVNDPPVAVNDSVVTPVNRAVTLSVIANDSDSDGVIDAATVDLDPSTAGQQSTFVVAGEGTFSDDGSGNVTFTPEAGFTGVSTIPYTVNDNDGGASNTAAIAVTVQPGPAANDDAVVTSLDTPVTFDITVNDIASANPLDPSSVDLDPATPGQQTTFAVASQGTFSVDALGNVTFTPETGFTGTVDISYTIEDIVGGVSNAAAIRVRVNAPPTAGDDSAVTPVDTPVTLSVIANDADTDGSIDAASVDLDPATAGRQTTFAIAGEGVFSVDDAGNATFTPELGFTGVSSASYTVNDNDGDASNAAAIDITVLAGPAANDDSASTQMDVAVTFDILANDVGGGSSIDPTTVDLDPSAAGQQNSLVAAGEGTFSVDAAGNVTFTPEAGFTGASSVTYVVDDALGSTSNVATITVTVNAPPTAVDDSALTPHNTPVTVSVVANDNDSDGSIDPASVDLDPAAAGQQTTFSVAGEGVYSVDGSGQVTFTPEANFVGVSTISYAVNDNDGAVSNLASIQVTVLNSGPLANDDTAHTPAGTPVAIPVLANDNDPDGDVLSLTLTPVTAPSNGVVTLLADGNVIYTPDAGFSGVDAFVYEVCDGFGACDTAQVAVTVSATDADNMPPTAVADNSHTLQDTPVDVIVLPNDVDPEGQLLTVTSPANPATTQGGVFSVTNNIITYTPPAGFTGVDTFVYEVCDVAGACDTAIVTVAVRPAGSDPVPTAVGDGAATQQGTAVAVDVLANDTHPTNDALTIAAFTDGAHGVVTLDDGGTPNDPSDDQLIYTPDAGFTGRDVFTYTVTDANGDAAIAAVSVTVGAVGEANIFDPPLGIKIINPAGFPELVWRMVWINNGNATANAARITDRIPDGTTYVPDSVQCEARGATTVTLCAFDADANQVVYEGSIAPDLGALTEEEADNELIFSFRAAVPPDFFGAVENQAEAHWDADGDGDIDDDIAGGQSPVVTDDPNTNDPGDVTATVFPPPPGVCLFQFQPVVLAAESAEADLDDHEDFHSDLVGVGARQQAALPLSLSTPLDGHVVAGSSVAVAALPGPSVDVTLSEPITVSVANDDVDALPDIIEADGVKVEALAAMADHIVVNRDGLAVILPAEVLESDATLEITTLSASQLPLPLPGQGAAGFYHLALSTGQTQLDAPVTLRFPYPDADENGLVDGSGVDEGLLTLWRYDAEAAQWRHLEPAWVIAERNVVSASTDQLGLVGLFRAADNRPATLALPSDDVVAFGAALSAVDASAASDGWFRIAQVAQMPYVAAWDTTAVADGDYRLRVACAQDAEALSAFESATAALGGGDSNSSNCFIATAAFDTPLAPQVQVLRDFRDAYLMRSAIGRWLVSQYYRLSPPLANIIRRHDGLRAATRVALTPLVWTAQLAPWAHGGLLAAGLLLALTGACSLGYWRWRQRRSY